MTHPIAKPSSPSVKLTAFDAPTITIEANGMNRIPISGRKFLKNGNIRAVLEVPLLDKLSV